MESREMTLDEWVKELPEIHRARREYDAVLRVVEAALQWQDHDRPGNCCICDDLDDALDALKKARR